MIGVLPPNETHLDIDLAAGEELTLEAGTPGSATIGVVSVRSLRMHGRPDKLNGGCEHFAVLNVRGCPRHSSLRVATCCSVAPTTTANPRTASARSGRGRRR